jgi:hypothetical protein
MHFQSRNKIDYKMPNNCYFHQKDFFFLAKQLQIENSGFVKTCDEYVQKWEEDKEKTVNFGMSEGLLLSGK